LIRFVTNRFLQTIPVLWGVITIVFLFLHFVPGDPVEIMLGENALPSVKEQVRASLQLDLPLWKQYLNYWKGLASGDLGQSILSKRPVADLIAERLPSTISLALITVFWSTLLSIPLGTLAAFYSRKATDHLILFFTIAAVSIPSFGLAPLLILFFSVNLEWLPVSEKIGWKSYILPSLTLGLGLCAVMTRMTRANLGEVLKQDYITTARAKGISEVSVVAKHALKNALVPVITIFGMQLGGLLAGALITETIFDWPGIGELVFRAIQSRDYPLVQGCVLIISMIYVWVNFLMDCLYGWVNPKMGTNE